MKNQRRMMILIVLLVFGVTLVRSQQQPPFPDEPPWFISIKGLDNFTLTSPTPMGTYSGSDIFTVGVNWPTGATVSGNISNFTPPLTNQAVVTVVPGDVPQGVTNCTVSVQVGIVLFDAPGNYQATLTITVINNQ